ncbi:MAG: primosomal protein N' [Verrucomicrobiota bacterium]
MSPESSSQLFVQIFPLSGGNSFPDGLSYAVPETLAQDIFVGSLIRVPLRNRFELGIVDKLLDERPLGFVLKNVVEVLHPFPVLTPSLIELARWMCLYYAASLDHVLESMIPVAIRKGMAPKVRVLIKMGECKPLSEEIEKLRKRAPQQAKLYQFIQEQFKPVLKSIILKRLKVGASSYQALVRKGWLSETYETVSRDPYNDEIGDHEVVSASTSWDLTEDQARVVGSYEEALREPTFSVRLLHGVTGSGKTEVYLQAAERVLDAGGSVLFLVPEIALAPQTVSRLRARLEAKGLKTVAWHSHLSDGERFDAWREVAMGETRIVVGARSAIFAPLKHLRLIIVDEEHEPSYKQDETPRYHGRDLAVVRAKSEGALCILGSATPSLETLFNVEQGKYAVDYMNKRIDDRNLPTIHIVDMRMEVLKNKAVMGLSQRLIDQLRDRFEKREQSILFLNRRGFASALQCLDCGWFAESPNSSIAMTYHATEEVLRCHLSGIEQAVPGICPQCGSRQLRKRGFGTQRIETSVRDILPRANIVRMDTDTMRRKDLYRTILNDFRRGRIDVLIGTQMIAKGLDFPNVTLVGLVDADLSMHMPDFRAAERTFQLLVQVAGRAGRGDAAGDVIAQTFTPHSGPLLFARQNDFEGFLAEELEQRREFTYPPFRHLIRHIFRGRNEDKVSFVIDQWVVFAEAHLGGLAEIRGPAPAPIAKIRDEYRFHVWFFTENPVKTSRRLQEIRAQFKSSPDVLDVLDVDPMNLS